MAAWHGRAVMAQREKYKDEISYNLALSVALHMGNDNSPATVSIKTLGAEAHCHYNTADKRTKELEVDGLLIIERDGKFLSYRIPGEFENESYIATTPPVVDHSDDIERTNTRLDALEEKVDRLCEVVERLLHDLHTIVTRPSHDLHTTVTHSVYENVNKVVEEVEEEIYNARATEIPPYELPDPYTPFPEIAERRMEMVSALSGVVKDVASVGVSEAKFEQAADELIKRGITIEQVKAFKDWWAANGYYPGKPALKSLLQEIENSINGVTRVTGENSNDYFPLWSQVKAEMSKNGRRSTRQWNGQIAPVLKKSGGYLRLCSLTLFEAEQTFKSAFQDMT